MDYKFTVFELLETIFVKVEYEEESVVLELNELIESYFENLVKEEVH